MQEEREGGLGLAAERMRGILGLESHPVAVKFLVSATDNRWQYRSSVESPGPERGPRLTCSSPRLWH
jgi:uncharacterized protein (DUF169 family)